MNNNPLISVIIPTYNHANYLRRALDSVFSQTYCNFEVIVVDNFSTDSTQEIIDSFKHKGLSHIKFHNEGVIGKSRNRGIKMSSGEWVAFLDSDDFWIEEKLEQCARYFKPNFDVIFHDMYLIQGNQKAASHKKLRGRNLKSPVLDDLLIFGNCIVNSAAVVRKSSIEKVNYISEEKLLCGAEDYNLWLKISKSLGRFKYVQKTLGFYRLHDISVSQKNMSVPIKSAVNEFSPLLDVRRRSVLRARIMYVGGRARFKSKNLSSALLLFRFSVAHGLFAIRVKSSLMILTIVYKLVFKKVLSLEKS